MLKITVGLLGSSLATMAVGLAGTLAAGTAGAVLAVCGGIALTFAVIASRAGR